MRRFRQGDAPVILYSTSGLKLYDFGLNRIIETDDEDMINLLLAMGAIEIPAAVSPVPQDLTEVAARINALDGRVVVIEGRADIRSVGSGLSLSGEGELSATGTGSGGGQGPAGPQGPPGEKGDDGYSPTVAVTDITGGHRVTITDAEGSHAFDVLDGDGNGGGDAYTKAETDELLASKSFIATYNVTTSQELIGYLDSAKEPFAPVVVKRGSDYYTAALATKSGDDKVILRVLGSGGGDYIVFNYTISGSSWASSSYTFQKKLTSGTDIKTVGGQSLLGSGNINIATNWANVANKPEGLVVDADYNHTDSNYTAAEKSKLAGLAEVKSIGSGLSLSGEGELSATGEGGTADAIAWANVTGKPDFAAVATSGSYNDLEDKPVIPAAYDDTALAGRVAATERAVDALNGTGEGSVSKAVSDAVDALIDGAPGTYDTLKEIADYIAADQTAASALAQELALKANSAGLATVATSGNYNDLADKPTIPKAYDDTALAGRIAAVEDKTVPAGGTTGQVLAKKSDGNNDVEWRTVSVVDDALSATSENPVQNKAVKAALDAKQGTLVSGTSIKTINNQSLLGSGNIDISGGGGGNSFLITAGTTTYEQTIAAINAGKELWFTNPDSGKLISQRPVFVAFPNTATMTISILVEGESGLSFDSWLVGNGTPQWQKTGAMPIARKSELGDLSTLSTTAQTDVVSAINEVKFSLDNLGEPFRVKQWASNSLNVEIPVCTEDIGNGSIPKMVYTIDDTEGADYQIVGMLSYELFDAATGGNRINCWPVCQFTGNVQKELSVRWMCGGTTRKTAKRISAWVLLKHR